jgi:proline iminopeptidase
MTESVRGAVEVDGLRLPYIVEGEGRPAIVVGSSLYYARCFSQNLRRHLRIAFMDHRGFTPGSSGTDVTQFGMDRLVADIERLRQQLGFEKVVIIGHSGHGFMALDYARRYPQHVSHLVMLCMGADYTPMGHAAAERYLADSVCPERKAVLAAGMARLPGMIEAAPEKAFVSFCLATAAKSWFDYRFDAAPLWEGIETNMAMFDHVWGKVIPSMDLAALAPKISASAFLGLGRYDFLVPPAHTWERVRDRFRDLTVRIFERSSHAPMLEEPEAFDRELLDWIGSR